MTKVMNVAMIGGGFMGKAHAMAYAAMPMFFWPAPAIPHRKVVVDVTDGMADEARRRYGFEEASSDWRAVVNRPDIDVVDICTPNNVHAEIAIAAAKAGKHIICEKPLARTVEEARAMHDAVKAGGVITANQGVKHWVVWGCNDESETGVVTALQNAGVAPSDILGVGLGAYLTCKDWAAGQDTGNKASLFISGNDVGSAAVKVMVDKIRNGVALPAETIADTHMVDATSWKAAGVVCT